MSKQTKEEIDDGDDDTTNGADYGESNKSNFDCKFDCEQDDDYDAKIILLEWNCSLLDFDLLSRRHI